MAHHQSLKQSLNTSHLFPTTLTHSHHYTNFVHHLSQGTLFKNYKHYDDRPSKPKISSKSILPEEEACWVASIQLGLSQLSIQSSHSSNSQKQKKKITHPNFKSPSKTLKSSKANHNLLPVIDDKINQNACHQTIEPCSKMVCLTKKLKRFAIWPQNRIQKIDDFNRIEGYRDIYHKRSLEESINLLDSNQKLLKPKQCLYQKIPSLHTCLGGLKRADKNNKGRSSRLKENVKEKWMACQSSLIPEFLLRNLKNGNESSIQVKGGWKYKQKRMKREA